MADERVQRRLAAILAADVVGYSRLMGQDEVGTLARLKSLRTEFLHPKVAEYGGRIVKTTGDGTLIEFGSAVDAVAHAVAVQEALAERNAALLEDQRIQLRLGINVGDIIIDGDDIYGDGVNVAARLEALADPGGICISARVHDYVGSRLDLAFDDLGKQAMKNIAEPIRVYRIRLDSGATKTADVPSEPPYDAPRLPDKPSIAVLTEPGGTGEPAPLPVPDKPSIAVLPFENMSGDPEQEYFADGIVEDIITALSRFRWFFVIARNSSFTYKGRNVDVRQVGRELGVRYILEGSVRKGGDQLRITAQLVEAATGNHLWAERYDGELADIFDLQDRITEGVVGAVEPSVRQAEIERGRVKRPDNLDVYDLYLRALANPAVGAPYGTLIGDIAGGLELLNRALEIDPHYAAAHGLAARFHLIRARWGRRNTFDIDAARRHADAVLSAHTDDATALAHAGFVFGLLLGDHKKARRALDRALSLNPNVAQALALSAALHSFSDRLDIALDHAQRSVRLSPHDPMRALALTAMSRVHFLMGRAEDAAEAAEMAIEASSTFVPAFAWLAASHVRLGSMTDARDTVRRLLEIEPNFRCGTWEGIAHSPAAQRDAVLPALREAGLPE